MVWPLAPMAPCDPAQTGCLRLGCRHLVPQADALPKLRPKRNCTWILWHLACRYRSVRIFVPVRLKVTTQLISYVIFWSFLSYFVFAQSG